MNRSQPFDTASCQQIPLNNEFCYLHFIKTFNQFHFPHGLRCVFSAHGMSSIPVMCYLSVRHMGFSSFFWCMADANVNRATGSLSSHLSLIIWTCLPCVISCLRRCWGTLLSKAGGMTVSVPLLTVGTICTHSPMSNDSCPLRKWYEAHTSLLSFIWDPQHRNRAICFVFVSNWCPKARQVILL